MFGLSSFFIVRAWYQQGNSGIPTPTILSKPVYAFGLLMLLTDALGNIGLVFGAAMTLGLAWQAQQPSTKTKGKPGVNITPHKTSGPVPAPTKPGANK